MLADRKSLLQYLRRTRFEAYSVLIARLGLKDNFAKQVRVWASVVVWDRSPAGVVAAAPVQHTPSRIHTVSWRLLSHAGPLQCAIKGPAAVTFSRLSLSRSAGPHGS